MAEGPQVGRAVSSESAYHSTSSSQTHLNEGAGLHAEGGANQKSEYCKELLMRGRTEFSFEELRAERYNQHRQQELSAKLKSTMELKEKLLLELEEKKKLLQLGRKQQVVPEGSSSQISDPGPDAASFQIYDESQCAAARPAGNELPDDVFLRPDERGLCLKVQFPRPGAVGPSVTRSGLQTGIRPPAAQNRCSPDLPGGTTTDLQTWPRPLSGPQKPASKTAKELSPIQETSVEAGSLTSLGVCSPVEEDRDQEQMDRDQEQVEQATSCGDPCDPDVRRRLLCDVTSCPDLHSEPRPLPAVEERSCLQLGGDVYYIYSKVVDGGSFSVFKGATEDENDYVLLKVDRCSVPWDFHQFQRLKKNSTSTDGLPLISCFLFLDGCITVLTTPPDHMFTELTECVPSEELVGRKAVALLQTVSHLHSCRLLHAALQPNILTCCSHRGFLSPDWLFPVDWSSSVDLDLQRDVTSVQQVPSAQTYIRMGLLEPSAPPQLVDLVGVAETVHLLLTDSRMVAVRDDDGWTAEKFRGDGPRDMMSRMWRRFFRSLLNVDGRTSSSVLTELTEQLSALYR